MTIEGYGSSKYTVNGGGEIIDVSGWRTGFKLNGNEILFETSSRYVVAGWLHSGGQVNYANDYSGSKPFSRWYD